jgi:2-iminoacetate synthase ThiH
MSSIIFNCEFCEYKTKRKYDLNRHQSALHPKNVMKQIKEGTKVEFKSKFTIKNIIE